MCRNSLPDQHRRHERCRYKHADAQCVLHLRREPSIEAGELLLMDCFFLAASCTGGSIVLVLLLVVELAKIGSSHENEDDDEDENDSIDSPFVREAYQAGDADFRIWNIQVLSRRWGRLRLLPHAGICSW